jgi:Ca2+-binding EF-hand superfamily protein
LPDVDETVWEGLIKEIDINGDGEIDFEEFNKMMNNSTQNTELFEEK